jgi:microcystin degradation protein MlrC
VLLSLPRAIAGALMPIAALYTRAKAPESAPGIMPVSVYAGFGARVNADCADNAAARAYGDATAVSKSLLDVGAENGGFTPMLYAAAAALLHHDKVGDVVTLELQGKQEPGFSGGPLRLSGDIRHQSDGGFGGNGPILSGIGHSFGLTAVLRVQGIDVLAVTLPLANAGLAAGLHLWHRPRTAALYGGQIDAAFPRRVQSDVRSGDYLRHWRWPPREPTCAARSFLWTS